LSRTHVHVQYSSIERSEFGEGPASEINVVASLCASSARIDYSHKGAFVMAIADLISNISGVRVSVKLER